MSHIIKPQKWKKPPQRYGSQPTRFEASTTHMDSDVCRVDRDHVPFCQQKRHSKKLACRVARQREPQPDMSHVQGHKYLNTATEKRTNETDILSPSQNTSHHGIQNLSQKTSHHILFRKCICMQESISAKYRYYIGSNMIILPSY